MSESTRVLSKYLTTYADLVRERGHDIESRDIQRELYKLAAMVVEEDDEALAKSLTERLKELQEDWGDE